MEPVILAYALKNELNALRPLSKEQELLIMQKFRLDWNYHSNNLEGNSLTYGETKALILFGITAQGKPIKDHFEVRGHNEAILWIEDVIKQQRPLTENFIRELHTLLLKEPYTVDAITPEGLPTKKQVKIGQYKSTPNHVQTKTGEIFRFASPEETPALMHELLEWYKAEKENPNVDVIWLATEFHYRFIRIHPFDDGNGRTARILMNFIFMEFGFPPVIIKTEEKANYISALEQADAGIKEPFESFIANNLVRSLQLMIRGAKGESIEEPDDIDKEILALKSELTNIGRRIEIVKSKETIIDFLKNNIENIEQAILRASNVFDDFFVTKRRYSYISGVSFSPVSNLLSSLIGATNNDTREVIFGYEFIELKYIGFENAKLQFFISFKFNRNTINIAGVDFEADLLYDEILDSSSLNKITTAFKKHGKLIIEGYLKQKKEGNDI